LVTITNFPAENSDSQAGSQDFCPIYVSLPNHPGDDGFGTRELPFTRQIYIERSDFSDDPPPKFHRLKPDSEVRLMGAYIIKCQEVVRNSDNEVVELRCTADFENSRERKVKGTIHWLSAEHCIDSAIMQYDRLFTVEEVGENYDEFLNRDSAKRIDGVKLEKSLAFASHGERFQFVRLGYFTPDSKNANVFNSIVDLKSSYKPS